MKKLILQATVLFLGLFAFAETAFIEFKLPNNELKKYEIKKGKDENKEIDTGLDDVKCSVSFSDVEENISSAANVMCYKIRTKVKSNNAFKDSDVFGITAIAICKESVPTAELFVLNSKAAGQASSKSSRIEVKCLK